MKKRTIFRLFLIPMIGVMIVQSLITLGMLAFRNVFYDLREYSVNTMRNTVSNRKMILENDMIDHWASVGAYEGAINQSLEEFLRERNMSADAFLASKEAQQEFLAKIFTSCLDMLHSSQSNGIFLILAGKEGKEQGEYPGFFVRDSNPNVSSNNYSDLLFERGNKNLSKDSGIPFDTLWTSDFHFEQEGELDDDRFFYEPLRAGWENPGVDSKELGYWAQPFTLEGNQEDSHSMISYSIPLCLHDKVYGVLGVEISETYLLDYLPSREINADEQAGYILAVRDGSDSYRPIAGEGVLYWELMGKGAFTTEKTEQRELLRIRGTGKKGNATCAVGYDLNIYGNNMPYDDTEWVLMGLNTEEELFGISNQLYLWLGVAILAGLAVGILAINLLVRRTTRPVYRLMDSIAAGKEGLERYTYANVREIDSLYDTIFSLFQRMEKAQNELREEKERYQIALQSTEAVFFSYDRKDNTVDIVNNQGENGLFHCDERDIAFLSPETIYYEDRAALTELFQVMPERGSLQFRMKQPEWEDYQWMEMSGKRINDSTGAPWKIIGSIQNIEEKKRREAIERQKKEIDDSSQLFTYPVGMEKVREVRNNRPEGTLFYIKIEQLYTIIEENGIIFTNILMELLGSIIRNCCGEQEKKDQKHTVAFRFSGDVLALWIPENEYEKAKRFAQELQERLANALKEEEFPLQIGIGADIANEKTLPEDSVRRAAQAQNVLSERGMDGDCFYWELTAEEERRSYKKAHGEVVHQPEYRESTLQSLALSLFRRESHFRAQVTLLLAKVGLFCGAKGVFMALLNTDYSSVYLEYKWDRFPEREETAKRAVRYEAEELADLLDWLKHTKNFYVSKERSHQEIFRKFTFMQEGESAIMLPLQDKDAYIGSIVLLGVERELAEQSESMQQLLEVRDVVQGQLNQKQRDLASKAKSQFLSRMSHEIRTPMNGIIGMTAIALQNQDDKEKILDCLGKIQSSSDYLLGLINDILDMSKIESGKMKLETADCNLRDMLHDVENLIRTQADAKSQNFHMDITLSHSWFVADKLRISQVLLNLLGNAVKYSGEGGEILLRVRETSADKKHANVEFAVIDTGEGIAKEEQERIFLPFEQIDEAGKAKRQGTGLGLPISNRLVQLMGSAIRLESAPGEGSTFSFQLYLPFGQEKEADEKKEDIDFTGYRVLIVEDNALNAEIAEELLKERGFEVEVAGDGQQAVDRIAGSEPGTFDLVLMDIMMPVMDGLEATRVIRSMDREDCRTLPIIAMSANAFDEDLKKSIDCGMNGHLSKPVEVDKMYEMFQEILSSRKLSETMHSVKI